MTYISRAAAAICLAGLSATQAAAQTQVKAFTPGEVAEGVNYALPRTIVNVDIAAVKTVYTPGEFAKYAERYLHLTGIEKEPQTAHTIAKMQVYTTGEPDTTKYFTVKLKDKTLAPLIQLDKNGVILAVNAKNDQPEHEHTQAREVKTRLNSKNYLTEEILAANSTAKMAELTALEIYNIRESRSSIMKGQVESMPKDGESMKIVLDGLDKQEAALMQLFTGHTDTTYYSETFSLDTPDDVSKKILFRFSTKLGFVDADDLAGEPYYISVSDKHTVVIPSEKDLEKRKITGIVYNMPSMAQVKVFTQARTLYTGELPFGQFGTTDMLSNTLFNKDATTTVTFDPASGGLQRITK